MDLLFLAAGFAYTTLYREQGGLCESIFDAEMTTHTVNMTNK